MNVRRVHAQDRADKDNPLTSDVYFAGEERVFLFTDPVDVEVSVVGVAVPFQSPTIGVEVTGMMVPGWNTVKVHSSTYRSVSVTSVIIEE